MSTVTEQQMYQPLEESFNYDKFHFQLIARQGDVALFAKTKPTHTIPGYEVVIVQKHEAHTFPSGKSYPPREAMPANEDWGKKAWTPGTWRLAIPFFKSVVYDLRAWDEPVRWLWPGKPWPMPDNEWVLNRELWEKQHGPPSGWRTEQEEAA